MQDILNYISSYGVSFVLVAYYIYKDMKYSAQQTTLITEVKELLIEIRAWIGKETEHDIHG